MPAINIPKGMINKIADYYELQREIFDVLAEANNIPNDALDILNRMAEGDYIDPNDYIMKAHSQLSYEAECMLEGPQ